MFSTGGKIDLKKALRIDPATRGIDVVVSGHSRRFRLPIALATIDIRRSTCDGSSTISRRGPIAADLIRAAEVQDGGMQAGPRGSGLHGRPRLLPLRSP